MKAALAGAAAAAVWQAPRIEGLSVAPDVAQAATCTAGPAVSLSHPTGFTLTSRCWGNTILLIGCGTFNTTLSVTPRFNANFTVNGSWGSVVGANNGQVGVTFGGIDPPFQSCTVDFAGSDCTGSGTTIFSSSPTSATSIGAPLNFNIACSGVALVTGSATLVLRLSCACA